ncbi:MAG: hypothetical protein ACOYMA_20370 [Bacteroidia bacterium]
MKYKGLIILFLWIVILTIFIWFSPYIAILPGYHTFYLTPQKYANCLLTIKQQKEEAKNKTTNQIKQLFVTSLTNKIFPFWYGTRWAFYGNSTIPGEGSIACGYFVTTTLSHVGVPLNRVKLAQCASEVMIKNLVQKQNIYHFNNLSLLAFIKGIKQKGKGLYIIGLDNHTGFVFINENNEVNFIHSSGRFPFCVVNENASESTILEKSVYKVVGKISDDELFLKNWVMN